MKELIKGVMPGSGHSIVYKSAKKGQKSFKVTQAMLKKLWDKVDKIDSKGVIILKIPDTAKENFILKCYLTKEKN